jgi:ribonucleoside-diphosphate reductase alpha chain
MRRKPPTTRRSVTHRFEILSQDEPIKGYVTIGLYDDGTPAEMFLVLAKASDGMKGLARCWATCFSLCLQYGVPIDALTGKFRFFRFEPAGATDDPDIPIAQSIVDYVCHWIEQEFTVHCTRPVIEVR